MSEPERAPASFSFLGLVCSTRVWVDLELEQEPVAGLVPRLQAGKEEEVPEQVELAPDSSVVDPFCLEVSDLESASFEDLVYKYKNIRITF